MTDQEETFCPACQTVVMVKSGSLDTDVVIDRCTECRGFWFDGGEIREFLRSDNFKGRFLAPTQPEAAPSIPAESSSEGQRECPRCHRKLDQLVIAGVTVDVCVECLGVWLDYGELGLLVQAGQQHQLEGDDSLLAHEIREGLSDDSLSPGLLTQIVHALQDLLSRYRA